jgi:hypothetical protein
MSTNPSRRVAFDSPEGWAMKYFSSATMLSGLQPPESALEKRGFGSLTVGLELGWLPTLSEEKTRVGFSGTKAEDLNKAPILIRPVVRLGLPWKFTVVAAGPPPLSAFGIKPRLFAFGLERPIVERDRWRFGWRGYGQVGSVKGGFTCPEKALGFPSGSPQNPAGCIGESEDIATLRHGGTELQFAYRPVRFPRLTPHVAAGVNFIDGEFQVNAPRTTRFDRSHLWTRGVTFNGTAGVSYQVSRRIAFTVDAFYSPLWVRREAGGPRRNDGLFNVRALLSYSLM